MKFSSVCVLGALSTTAALHTTGQPYVRVYSTASNPLRKCWLNQKQSYCPRDNAWGRRYGYDKCMWSNGKCKFDSGKGFHYFRCPGSTGEGEICECNYNEGYIFTDLPDEVPCMRNREYEEYEEYEYEIEGENEYEYEIEYENFREYENNEYEYEGSPEPEYEYEITDGSRCMKSGCLGAGSCLFEATFSCDKDYFRSEETCNNVGGLWCGDFEYEYEEYENKEYEEYEYEYEHRFFCGYGSYLANDGMSCEVDLNTVCTGLTKPDAQGRHCVIDMEAIVQTVNDNGTPFKCKTVGQGQDCKQKGANLAINTAAPTTSPTLDPTGTPTTEAPTAAPTDPPTSAPTQKPTATPTSEPTESPTNKPTESPTKTPTVVPTNAPTDAPTSPTSAPTRSCSSIKYGGWRYKWNLCKKQKHCRVAQIGRRNVCTATLPPTTLAPTAPTDSPTTGAPTILDVCKGKNRRTCRNRVNKAKCLWARQGRRWTCKMKN